MILVITIDKDPITTNVCLWLLHFKKQFYLLSIEDIVEVVKIEGRSMVIKNVSRGYEIDLKNVQQVLYRQGDVLRLPDFQKDQDKNLSEFLIQENRNLRQYFYHKIKQKIETYF